MFGSFGNPLEPTCLGRSDDRRNIERQDEYRELFGTEESGAEKVRSKEKQDISGEAEAKWSVMSLSRH